MNDFDRFELRFAAALRADADLKIGRFDPSSIALAAITRDRRRSLRSRLGTTVVGLQRPMRRSALLVLVALGLVLALGAATLLVGGHLLSPGPGPFATSTAAATPVPASRLGFTPTGSMTMPRTQQTATLLRDGRVLIAGGSTPALTSDTLGHKIITDHGHSSMPHAPAELYDPATGTFNPTGSMTIARTRHAAVVLHDGRVLILGGASGPDAQNARCVGSAELYDPASGTFSPTGSMTVPGVEATPCIETATLLPDGRVLVMVNNYLATPEIYDPTTGAFRETTPMAKPRAGATVTVLADGRVLIVGGIGAPDSTTPASFVATAELFDPATGTFRATGLMKTPRIDHEATPLPGGRVLIVGGSGTFDNAVAVTEAEVYDPAAGTFSGTGSLATVPIGETVSTLQDGRVLVVGGTTNQNLALASAELYDPTTGMFDATGQLVAARTWHTATVLLDGRVLITGGNADIQILDSAESFAVGSGVPAAGPNASPSRHPSPETSGGMVPETPGIAP